MDQQFVTATLRASSLFNIGSETANTAAKAEHLQDSPDYGRDYLRISQTEISEFNACDTNNCTFGDPAKSSTMNRSEDVTPIVQIVEPIPPSGESASTLLTLRTNAAQ